MNNNVITLEGVRKLLSLLQPKEVHINQKTFDAIKPHLEFEPDNLIINNYIPDDQAIVIDSIEVRGDHHYKKYDLG